MDANPAELRGLLMIAAYKQLSIARMINSFEVETKVNTSRELYSAIAALSLTMLIVREKLLNNKNK